jgi:hypothetical protein
MKFENIGGLSDGEFSVIGKELKGVKTLGDVLVWAGKGSKEDFLPQIVSEVITQDEFTHDVIIPYRDLFLVFDTT